AAHTAVVPVRSGIDVAGAVQRLAGALLLLAARRYSEPVRSELVQEWTGELHAIVHDDDRGQFYRDYWALLYSGSLALTALSRQARQTAAAISGATRRKIGLIAVIFCAVISTSAVIAAFPAYAAATAPNADS